MEYIGAIDQGTTSTRFMLFDHEGNVVAMEQREHEQILPRPGWVEHDPMEIIDRTEAVIRAVLARPGIDTGSIVSVGLTNQRETALVWDPDTGLPFYNAIVWQDTRTDSIVSELGKNGKTEFFRDKTGLPPATYFSGPKIQWILENVPEAKDAQQKGRIRVGTIDSWLLWNLTGGTDGGIHATDVTNASRTMMMDLAALDWDKELCDQFGIDLEILPRIRSCVDHYGTTRESGPFGTAIPIQRVVGDQQAATVGQTCFEPGHAKNTYGTGNFMLLNTGRRIVQSKAGLLSTPCYRITEQPPVYALEGSIAVTGSAIQWLRDQLGLISQASDIESLANSVEDTGGICFVPAFSGLFAPYWRSDARGVVVGMSRYTNKGHLARATLEAICYQSRDVLEAMKSDAGIDLKVLKVDGGATVNNTLMQLQADILGVTVVRPLIGETTSLGAAYAAGLGSGFWSNLDELSNNWQEGSRWEPSWGEDQRESGYSRWKKAVERTLKWIDI
jgi:glycerol kinase